MALISEKLKEKAKEDEQKRVDDKLKFQASAIQAKACFDDPKFKKYKQKYERLEKDCINKLIDFKGNDQELASFARTLAAELRVCKMFLRDVEKQAGEG